VTPYQDALVLFAFYQDLARSYLPVCFKILQATIMLVACGVSLSNAAHASHHARPAAAV